MVHLPWNYLLINTSHDFTSLFSLIVYCLFFIVSRCVLSIISVILLSPLLLAQSLWYLRLTLHSFALGALKNIDASVDSTAVLARSSAVQRSLSLAIITPVSLLLRELLFAYLLPLWFPFIFHCLAHLCLQPSLISWLFWYCYYFCCWCYPFFFPLPIVCIVKFSE